MILESLSTLFQRDLKRLASEIEKYKDEPSLWITEKDINNSAGNLCLHLIGNLNHFIGHVIGNSDYQRDRIFEFSGKDVPKKELLEQISKTSLVLKSVLESLQDSDLKKQYPIEVFGKPLATGMFMIHLQGHLNYHLGQINYHRRLVSVEAS